MEKEKIVDEELQDYFGDAVKETNPVNEKEKTMRTEASSKFLADIVESFTDGPIADELNEFKDQETILDAEVEGARTKISFGRDDSMEADFLILRLQSGLTVYVPQRQAGLKQPKDLSGLVGQRKPVVITHLVELDRDARGTEKRKFCAFGSIQMAEFLLGTQLYRKYEQDPEAFKRIEWTGTITTIFRGSPSISDSMLVNLRGLTVYLPADEVNYNSSNYPFDRNLAVGQEINFKIKRIEKEEVDKKLTDKVDLKGDTFNIMGSRMGLIKTPEEEVLSLAPGSTIKAFVTNVHTVDGIFVEVFPKVTWKLRIPNHIPEDRRPTRADAIENTEITGIVQRMPKNYRKGTLQFKSFVHGPSKKTLKF